MAVLVLADHQDGALSQPTRSAVAAAAKLGDVHVLIAGGATGAAAAQRHGSVVAGRLAHKRGLHSVHFRPVQRCKHCGFLHPQV